VDNQIKEAYQAFINAIKEATGADPKISIHIHHQGEKAEAVINKISPCLGLPYGKYKKAEGYECFDSAEIFQNVRVTVFI